MPMPKSQAAMEYLTVYGWAIIVIIVVLAVLYSLGLFNSNAFSAKEQQGACQVYRPYGPGTVQLINLQGICDTGLPKYVAIFNGQSSYIVANNILGSPPSFTISVWVSVNEVSTQQIFVAFPGGSPYIGLGIAGGNACTDINGVCYSQGKAFATNVWYNYIVTYSSGNTITYINDVAQSNSVSIGPLGNTMYIGQFNPGSLFTSGFLSNIQVYNTSLSTNTIRQLYVSGAGGPPTRLQNLVGWWPLNGDTNDYSGNGNNGVSNNIAFTTAWTNGYSTP